MKKKSVLQYFGSQTKIASALGITKQAVCQWGDEIPPLRALQLEHYTAGYLKANHHVVFPSSAKP